MEGYSMKICPALTFSILMRGSNCGLEGLLVGSDNMLLVFEMVDFDDEKA